MKFIGIILVTILIVACSPIQTYESFSKEPGIEHTTSIGSELYRIKKQKDLPNAFGNTDIYGGKVDSGYTKLRLMSVASDGSIIFRLTDIDIETNATTMSRYGTSTTTVNSTTTANASVYGNTAYGTANTNATMRHYEKPKEITTQLPPNTVEFAFNPSENVLQLEGVSIEVKNVTPYSIKYVLHR